MNISLRRTETNCSVFLSAPESAGFTCDLGIMSLLCTDGETIDIESAYYGINADECASECCPAAPGDCTESLEETAPLDWTALLALCQGQRFCQFEHPGRSLASCPGPVDSDYIVVSYTCQGTDTYYLLIPKILIAFKRILDNKTICDNSTSE